MINGTLLLQIIHFFCAYLICKHVLLIKVLEVVEQQNAESAAINRSIVELKNNITCAIDKKNALWSECLQKIRLTRPSFLVFKAHRVSVVYEVEHPRQYSDDEKKQLVHTMAVHTVKVLSGGK